jgi:hypothetical protein
LSIRFLPVYSEIKHTIKPGGTIEENGVGKFNDFTEKALNEIKDLGQNYIWYTDLTMLWRDYCDWNFK